MPKTKNRYQISTAAMRETITKLSLHPGDALLVRHAETLRYLENSKMPLDFNVPIIFSPGGIEKLSRADLLNLLEQLDSASTPSASAAVPRELAPNGVAQ